MLKRLLESLAAPAGAVWTRTPRAISRSSSRSTSRKSAWTSPTRSRQSHGELLRLAVAQGKPMHLPPRSGVGHAEEGKHARRQHHRLPAADRAHPAQRSGRRPHRDLAEPQPADRRRARLPPVHDPDGRAEPALPARPDAPPDDRPGTALDAARRPSPARSTAASTRVEVSYLVANEARRLIECDRVSVAVRYGRNASIEAVSGADVVEKRSNAVRLMRSLCDQVLKWGEKLVFNGVARRQPAAQGARRPRRLPGGKPEQAAGRAAAQGRAREQEQEAAAGRAGDGMLRAAGRPAAAPRPPRRGRPATPPAPSTTPSSTAASRSASSGCRWPRSRKASAARPAPSSWPAASPSRSSSPSSAWCPTRSSWTPTASCCRRRAATSIRRCRAASSASWSTPGESFAEGRSLVEMYDFPDLGQKILTLQQDKVNARAADRRSLKSKEAKDLEPEGARRPDARHRRGRRLAHGARARRWRRSMQERGRRPRPPTGPASSSSRRRPSPTNRPCGSTARSGRSSTATSRRS